MQYVWRRKLEYRFRFVDEYTRIQFFYDGKIKDSNEAIKAFKQAKRYFPFKIYAIQRDNGSEFRGNFHTYLKDHNITHHFIPKRSAPWNGKVERAHGTIHQEYSHNPHRIFRTPYQCLKWYNYQRLHLGINGLTPYEKFLEFKSKSVTP